MARLARMLGIGGAAVLLAIPFIASAQEDTEAVDGDVVAESGPDADGDARPEGAGPPWHDGPARTDEGKPPWAGGPGAGGPPPWAGRDGEGRPDGAGPPWYEGDDWSPGEGKPPWAGGPTSWAGAED